MIEQPSASVQHHEKFFNDSIYREPRPMSKKNRIIKYLFIFPLIILASSLAIIYLTLFIYYRSSVYEYPLNGSQALTENQAISYAIQTLKKHDPHFSNPTAIPYNDSGDIYAKNASGKSGYILVSHSNSNRAVYSISLSLDQNKITCRIQKTH